MWDFESFRKELTEALQSTTAMPMRQRTRAKYSPSLSYGRHFAPPYPTAKPAAVMVCVECLPTVEDWRKWTIPLTLRPTHLPDHPGQISLPGGRLEEGESPLQAAQREFREELGVDMFHGVVLGELSPLYVYNSDYYVTPFVAVASEVVSYRPCEFEVERLIHLPLRDLLAADENLLFRTYQRGRASWTAPGIRFQSDTIWGATAMILGEFSAILTHLLRSN